MLINALKNTLRGIILIIIASIIILVADLNNRKKTEDIKQTNALQEGKVYKIGIGYFAPEIAWDNCMKGVIDGLAEDGFVLGKNLELVQSHANAEIASIPAVFQNLDNQDVDLIMASSTPCLQASIKAVKKKPVVFTFVYDPIAAGAGKSFDDHYPNVTGVGSFPPVEETVDFIKKFKPSAKVVGTIYNSSEANSRKVIASSRDFFKKQGLKLEEITITNTAEVFQAAQVLCSKNIDVLWITGDNTVMQAFDAVVKNMDKSNVPIIVNDVEFIDKGAMAGVGIGWYETGKYTSKLLKRVLLGEKPANIPFENFVQKSISLNHKKAKEKGIVFPNEILEMEKNTASTTSSKPQKKLKLVLVHYVDSPVSEECEKGIMDGFKKYNYEINKDFSLKIMNANGDIGTLNSIINAVTAEKYDIVLLTSTPPLQAIAKKIKNTPVVFSMVADPVAAGAGKSFTDHQDNITGVSTFSNFEKMIGIIKQVMPNAKTLGTIFVPAEINSVVYHDYLKQECNKNNIKLISIPVTSTNEVSDAAKTLVSKGIDAVCQINDNTSCISFPSILDAANKAKKPLFSFVSTQVKDGAIMCIARDYYTGGIDAIKLFDRIVKGENPKNIPFEYVSKTNLIINMKVVKQYNLKIPEKLLKEANEIIK